MLHQIVDAEKGHTEHHNPNLWLHQITDAERAYNKVNEFKKNSMHRQS